MKIYWAPKGELPEDARRLRTEIFVVEQKFTEEFDEQEKECWHMVVYDGEEAVATGRMYLLPDGCAKLGRIAVVKARRGEGLGAVVVHALSEKAKELGCPAARLGAQEHARGFYEKLGFAVSGEMYYEEYCPHLPMEKSLL